MIDNWYHSEPSHSIEQGDILVEAHFSELGFDKDGFLVKDNDPANFIVLSQTCDIENNKLPQVLIAYVEEYDKLKIGRDDLKSSEKMKAIADNQNPSIFLLPPAKAVELDWLLCLFHTIFTVPREALDDFVESGGIRVSMKAPYRELLSQHYGHHLSRIAIDNPLGSEFIAAKFPKKK